MKALPQFNQQKREEKILINDPDNRKYNKRKNQLKI